MNKVYENIFKALENEYNALRKSYKETNNFSFYFLSEGIRKSVGIVHEESKKQNNNWISVKKRLPDVRNKEYIVMIKYAKVPTCLYFEKSGKWVDGLGIPYRVVAWQDFPAPYRED